MSFQKIIIEKMKCKGFTNFFDSEPLEIKYINIKADVVHNKKTLLMIKNYDNWINLIESWETDQIDLLNILRDYPSYSTKAYLILVLENYKVSDDKFDIAIIERDERICKKYLITTYSDLSNIPVMSELEFDVDSSKSYETLFYSDLSSEFLKMGIYDEVKAEINRYFNVQEADNFEDR